VSELGTEIGTLATSLLAIGVLHASAGELGALGMARTAPFLLLALPAGAWLDRMRRRPVMIVADLGRFALLASVPVTYAAGWLSFAQLYAVTAVVGGLTVFFDLGYQSYLPSLVERHRLTEANAKVTAALSAAQVAGPGAAGILVEAVGAAATVTVDAVSFLASGLLCLRIRGPEPAPGRGTAASLRREIAEGMAFVLRHPVLRRIGVCSGVTNLASSTVAVLLPLYMVRSLGYAPETVGLVFALAGGGLVTGSLVANPVLRRIGFGRTILCSVAISALGLALLPLGSFGALAGGEALFGVAVPLYNVAQISLRQAITEARLLGRVNSCMRLMSWSTLSVGSLLGGFLSDATGPRPALAAAAVIAALSGLTLVRSPILTLRGLPSEVRPSQKAVRPASVRSLRGRLTFRGRRREGQPP
jgi:MFS family permease